MIKLVRSNNTFEDDPRSRLIDEGGNNMSNIELMAIVLGSGIKGESVLSLAQRVLELCDHKLSALSSKTIQEFKIVNGIGDAKAALLFSIFELGRRRQIEESKVQKINGSSDVNLLMNPILADLVHEEFWVIYLNKSNSVIKKERISLGGISSTVVDVRIIIKKALLHLASSLILVHNHPSGNTNPSQQDENITKKMKSACKLLEINLLDHLIISGNSYYSFADNSGI